MDEDRAISLLRKLQNDNYILYVQGELMDSAVDLACKALNNQKVINELIGRGDKN